MKKKIAIKPFIIASVISLIIGAGIFCLVFFLNGRGFYQACNGAAYAAVSLICISGFIYVCRCGFFDFVSYGFKQLGSQLFSKKANKYNDFVSYKDEKRTVRSRKSKYFLGILIVGVAFLVASIIFLILFKKFDLQ